MLLAVNERGFVVELEHTMLRAEEKRALLPLACCALGQNGTRRDGGQKELSPAAVWTHHDVGACGGG